MSTNRTTTLNPLTLRSIFLNQYSNGQHIGCATGFIFESGKDYYLITNKHVVTGENFFTHDPLHPSTARPDKIGIYHHYQNLGYWDEFIENLYDYDTGESKPRWIETSSEKHADVIALKLTEYDQNTLFYTINTQKDTDIFIDVGLTGTIIGFPLGKTVEACLPIWKSGFIASEPEVHYQGMPAFLMDTDTKSGMSGSPVFMVASGQYMDSKGNINIGAGIATKFLGIYSARPYPLDLGVGLVWKREVLEELFEVK